MISIVVAYIPIRKLYTGPSDVYSPKVCMSFPFNLDFWNRQIDSLQALKYIHL